MPFKLLSTTLGQLLGDIYQYQQIHGARLFEQRLYETVQENSKVQQVRLSIYYEIYSSIEEWGIQKFTAPETLKECTWLLCAIQRIDFCNLTVLKLQSVGLTNLQPIAWLNAPHLKDLNLNHNHFLTYKPLSKSYLPKLQTLQLQQNLITTTNNISQILYIARMGLGRNTHKDLGKFRWPEFRKKSPEQYQSFKEFSMRVYDFLSERFCVVKVDGGMRWGQGKRMRVGGDYGWELEMYG